MAGGKVYPLTNRQARQFMLAWQGLLGARRFSGAAGALAFVRQAGCVQFDPVDLCGKNAELVLFSRVAGFKKPMLDRLLYRERQLVEHWDKNLAIYPAEDWPCFGRNRQNFRGWSYTDESRLAVEEVLDTLRARLAQQKVLSAQGTGLQQTIAWPWGQAKLGGAALEYLYFCGEAVVHHRQGAVRHYAPAAAHLPAALLQAPDPNPDDAAYYAWHTLRRVAAVGLLWNRGSDAFLGIPGYSTALRQQSFAALLAKGALVECAVEGMGRPLYAPAAALPLLQQIMDGAVLRRRLELVAPLDSLMWDRKLIKALFGFAYKWEIYTPQAQRSYGPYVLGVLDGDGFAGRIDVRANREQGCLTVQRYWPEAGKRPGRAFGRRLEKRLRQFAQFNGCGQLCLAPQSGLQAITEIGID